MSKDQLEAVLWIYDRIAAVFIALVVVGVAGEFIVHILGGRKNRDLAALQDREILQLKVELGVAQQKTAEANQLAAEAKEHAAYVGSQRSITIPQLLILKKMIPNTAGGWKIVVVYPDDDGETHRFAANVLATLRLPMYMLNNVSIRSKSFANKPLNELPVGVVVHPGLIQSVPEMRERAEILQNAFFQAGISSRQHPSLSYPGDDYIDQTNTLTVVIGSKEAFQPTTAPDYPLPTAPQTHS